MQASQAARIFHDWAYGEGLVADGSAAHNLSSPADFALITNVSDSGKMLLRARQIQAVSFNDAANEIIVFTKRAAPSTKKQIAALPKAIDDVSIKYRQGLQNPIGSAVSAPFGGPAYTIRTAAGANFYTCGSSISVGNFRDAGTLCCLVRDQAGTLYGMSNNHVSGSCSHAGIGLPILAPGIFDVAPGGLAPFTIGFHHAALPLIAGSADNVSAQANRDAAIFRIHDPLKVSSYQGDSYDTPPTVAPLVPGIQVEKVGRTTGHTHGQVISQFYGAHPIQYSVALYGFSGVVSFEPAFVIVGNSELFSDNGDSGSLITSVDSNGQRNAVGIVVGGMNDSSAPGGKITIALSLTSILTELAVDLVSSHNV